MIEPPLLHAWAVGRSLSRGLPPPVADRGGFRIDTGSDAEVARWIFAAPCPGIAELGREIRVSRHPIKLCDTTDRLLAALPEGWIAQPTGTVMRGASGWRGRPLPPGYGTRIRRTGTVTHAQIVAADGAIAATGHAAETPELFVYDRIETAASHRRQGLGGALMTLLRDQRVATDTPELLIATEDGRRLYESLGWQALAPYSTAFIERASTP